jgi:CBS domain-containing membrane protein
VSAIVGVTCAKLIGNLALASGIGVMLAIAAMFLTRSLHPPGGAVALTSVIGGSAVTGLGYQFVVLPVAINSALILLIALIFNQALRRRYPNRPAPAAAPHHTSDPAPSQRLGLSTADIDFALQQHGELLDISRDDLQSLLQDAQLHARRERVGVITCQQIMSRDVITVNDNDSAQIAWDKLAYHQIKALPVIDADGYLAGIISLHDLLVEPTSHLPRNNAQWATQSVASLMTRKVQYARPEQALVELVPLFSDGGLHHLPVIEARRVVGIITQSDMVAALFRLPQLAAAN